MGGFIELKVLSAGLKVLSAELGDVMVDARYRLFHGDCLDILPTLEAGSVDAVICDPPYGTTDCSWDSAIPFAPMWSGIKHVLKAKSAVVLFAGQPFTSALVMSNPKWFRYDLVWQKDQATGGLNANRMPLRSHEDILIFYDGLPTYNPQMFDYRNSRFKLGEKNTLSVNAKNNPQKDVYGDTGLEGKRIHWFENGQRYPLSVVYCSSKFRSSDNANITSKLHPTQKPVALLEYLIRTYTNEGDVVLDFTMGSGTTGVAAMNTGRRFVGVEMDAGYYAIAQERIGNAAGDYRATAKEEARGMKALFW